MLPNSRLVGHPEFVPRLLVNRFRRVVGGGSVSQVRSRRSASRSCDKSSPVFPSRGRFRGNSRGFVGTLGRPQTPRRIEKRRAIEGLRTHTKGSSPVLVARSVV